MKYSGLSGWEVRLLDRMEADGTLRDAKKGKLTIYHRET